MTIPHGCAREVQGAHTNCLWCGREVGAACAMVGDQPFYVVEAKRRLAGEIAPTPTPKSRKSARNLQGRMRLGLLAIEREARQIREGSAR